MVVQMGAPKGSSRLIQRIGRSNHRMDEPSRALLAPSNRFEVLVFMTWSMVLIYLVIGSTYRLSLMGAFTAPVASALLLLAVSLSPDDLATRKIRVNPWLEAHTSFSMVACGAFALACVAGVMYLVQEQQGYISGHAMQHVAEAIGCTTAEVEDVVSYYVMFFTRQPGKYVLQVCRTLSCALNGAERVTEALAGALGIAPGQTDASRTFTLMEVECLGACDRAPVVMVNDAWHECLKPEDARRLIDDLKTKGEAALTGCHHLVEKQ